LYIINCIKSNFPKIHKIIRQKIILNINQIKLKVKIVDIISVLF